MTKEATKGLMKFLSFRDLVLWDVKRYASEKIKSNYPIVKLGFHIQEQSQKIKLFDFPEKEFGILGVNNKIGIFDAYKEKGGNLNQAYKRMEKRWLAYNPYRVNVGSIGMRTEENEHEFISPAYVVFSCKETILPDFLFKLFKTERFNKIINESTTGSVRQNLTIDMLKSLDVPLIPINIQKSLLKDYYKKTDLAKRIDKEIIKVQNAIEDLIINKLGVAKQQAIFNKKGLHFVAYKSISRWALSYITDLKSYSLDNAKFGLVPLKQVITMFEGGKTPSTSNKAYWDGTICWTSPKDFNGFEIHDSEDKITELAVNEGMKVHPAGTLLGVFRSGILRHSFPVAITHIPTAINQDLKAMNVKSDIIDKDYFLIYLHTFQKMILEMASKVGVTVESINSDEFLEIPIVLPPINFQQELVNEVLGLESRVKEMQGKVEQNKKAAIKEFEQAIFKN
jgi:type I restriction enzyme S subunit